jgi:hypothetical protein
LLAAILNQLVFWSGKSSLENGWFYKEHAALAKEFALKTAMWSEKRCSKLRSSTCQELSKKSFARWVVHQKHYRIDQEALISRIFPQTLDSAQEPNGNKPLKVWKRLKAEWKRLKSRIEASY